MLTVSGPVVKPTGFTGETRTATVRTNAIMREGNTITFTYKHAMLPDILDVADITTYSFTITLVSAVRRLRRRRRLEGWFENGE